MVGEALFSELMPWTNSTGHLIGRLTLAAVVAACSSDAPTAPETSKPLYVVTLNSFCGLQPCDVGNSIAVYTTWAPSDGPPSATIVESNTGLYYPWGGIALDAAGQLYVTSEQSTDVGTGPYLLVYAPGATGKATPTTRTGEIASSYLNDLARGFVLDAGGRLFVARGGIITCSGYVQVYTLSPNGQLTLTTTIGGSNTGIDNPTGSMAFDGAGQLYVVNTPRCPPDTMPSITVYSSGSTGNATPTATISGSNTGLNAPRGIAVDAAGRLYVANHGDSSIKVYPAGATGDVAPIATIAGSNTGLTSPGTLVLDAAGRLYVANDGAEPSITVFAAGATGNVPPTATLAGASTGLNSPSGMALDAAGRLYVENGFQDPSITVYEAGATGNVTPVARIVGSYGWLRSARGIAHAADRLYVANGSPYNRIVMYGARATGDATPNDSIAGGNTGLNDPQGIALDPTGRLYVANSASSNGNPSVTIYAAGARGNVAPIATIGGANTGLVHPRGIALDAAGRLYVANGSLTGTSGSITVYSAGATGDAAPIATIAGTNTGLRSPFGIAVDAAGRLYVTATYYYYYDSYYAIDSSIAIYAPGATGNVAPIATIAGSATGLQQPLGITLDAAGRLPVGNWGGTPRYASTPPTSSILFFAPGATGNAAFVTIGTGLGEPTFLTF